MKRARDTGQKKSAPAKSARQYFSQECERQVLHFIQSPFAWGFWLIEQRIAALDDEIERRRS